MGWMSHRQKRKTREKKYRKQNLCEMEMTWRGKAGRRRHRKEKREEKEKEELMGGKTAEGEFRGESKRLAGKVLHKSSGVLRKEMFRIVGLIFKVLIFFGKGK